MVSFFGVMSCVIGDFVGIFASGALIHQQQQAGGQHQQQRDNPTFGSGSDANSLNSTKLLATEEQAEGV